MTVPARLHERFGRRPLTLVIAPAGFGKTTLLRSWWQRVGDTPKALVSFDHFTRPAALDAAHALVAGLASIGVDAARAEELIELVPPDGSSFGSEFVRAVDDTLRAVPGPFTLFLDDAHGLVPEASHELGRLASLTANDRHRVVVATRTEPLWPVRRWQTAGFADVVNADDLRLTTDEIAASLGPAQPEIAARIATLTGGWAAALEAVRWHLDIDPTVEIETAVLDLVDYVDAEVLPALEPADVLVLRRTSILDSFPSRVAAMVAGDVTTGRVLEETARRTSLVTKLPDGRFAYHAVLREALHRHLLEHEPDVERDLHLRAAEAWLDEPTSFGNLVNAIDHLVEARSWKQTAALLRRSWPELETRSRLDLFVRWVDAIPQHQSRHDPELTLLHGWANLRIGHAWRALDDFRDSTIATHPRAAAAAKVLYASTASHSADPEEVLTLCEQLEPLLPQLDLDPGMRRVPSYAGASSFTLLVELARLTSFTYVGRCAEAARGYEHVLHRRSDMTPLLEVAMRGALAWNLALRGEMSAASEHAACALQLASDTGAGEHSRTVPALGARALVDILTGDPGAALTLIDDAAARCRRVRAANMLRMCDLCAAMVGPHPSYLVDVEPALTPARLALVDQFVVVASARRRARQGDHAGAEAELRTTVPHELTLSAWVEILLAGHERRAVARWLRDQPLPSCPHAETVRYLAEGAVAERPDQVAAAADAAAKAASAERLVGVLMHAPSQFWARSEVIHSGHPLLLEAADRLATDPGADRSTPLTARELDLLRLLPLSLGVDQLADRLFISVHTVKWHRANLYRKLGAKNRHDAVIAATERGLLESSA